MFFLLLREVYYRPPSAAPLTPEIYTAQKAAAEWIMGESKREERIRREKIEESEIRGEIRGSREGNERGIEDMI